MGSWGFWHGFGVLFYLAVFVVPCWRIVQRAGFHPALSLLVLFPVVNIILLWVFAFVRWPVDAQRA